MPPIARIKDIRAKKEDSALPILKRVSKKTESGKSKSENSKAKISGASRVLPIIAI